MAMFPTSHCFEFEYEAHSSSQTSLGVKTHQKSVQHCEAHPEGVLPDGVDLVNDLHVPGQQLGHDLHWPLLQSLWHYRVISEGKGLQVGQTSVSLCNAADMDELCLELKTRHPTEIMENIVLAPWLPFPATKFSLTLVYNRHGFDGHLLKVLSLHHNSRSYKFRLWPSSMGKFGGTWPLHWYQSV